MKEQQKVEEQEVRDLISGAGPRVVPPAEDVAAIREAARVEWREMVAAERRRRRGARIRVSLAVAAGVILAVAVAWWWTARAPVPAPIVATVELLAGNVRDGDGLELGLGGELTAGSVVEAAGWLEGEPAGAALRLSGGQSLRLAAGSAVGLLSASRIELRRGALYVDSEAGAEARGVEVITALGTVRDIGTQFEVRLGEGEAALRVRVREGQVAVEAEHDRYLANPGDQLSVLSDGSVTSARVNTYGPEWDWVLATTPSIDFDGLSVGAVVRWFARETGREIRYADAALEALAEEDIVSGSSVGFTPEQTLSTAFLGSALRHQVENGTILIDR